MVGYAHHMTITFHNYQVDPIPPVGEPKSSPNLVALRDDLLKKYGGMSLGIYGDRDVRGGTSKSTHASGAALDWRYADPGPGRAVLLAQVMPLLTEHPDVTGIQAVHDYAGGRIWRVNRPNGQDGWVPQKADKFGMGQAWALWVHIEVHPDFWSDGRTLDEKFGVTQAPVFDPEHGLFSLWPLNPDKPALKVGSSGDAVRYIQGVLRSKLGYGLPVDGMYGPTTEANVRWFQGSHGLTADGLVGRKTWAAIDRVAIG